MFIENYFDVFIDIIRSDCFFFMSRTLVVCDAPREVKEHNMLLLSIDLK